MDSENDLTEKAGMLTLAAKTVATTSYTNVLDRFPALEKVDKTHWDFILTTAGVFVGISQLNHEGIAEEKKDEVRDVVANSLLDVYPDGVKAVEDCTTFVDSTHDGFANLTEYKENPQWLFLDCLGSWIVGNVLGHLADSDDERQLVRVLGGFVVHGFTSWWK